MTCSSAFNGLLVLGTDQGELLIFQLIKVNLSAWPFWNCSLSNIVSTSTSSLLVSFLRPAHLLPVSQWLAQTVDQSWRSVYHKTDFQSQLWSRKTRFQNQSQIWLVKMIGWVRSLPAVKIAPSQLSRSSPQGLSRSPTYFRWFRFSDLPHTSGEAMNDPSIYPLRSPWAKVKISPSLMKSSAIWPQIRAVEGGWCGGQGCAYISPSLGA